MSSSGKNLEKYRIPLDEITKATENFSTKIGDGGFGEVYEGKYKDKSVAVKRLGKGSHQGIKEFRNELNIISNINHRNIIPFIGYCDDGSEMIMVYEYASKGSLDSHLKDANKKCKITWSQRLEICLGVAEGLKHLHSGSEENNGVVHRDMKSGNILLGKNLEAKIGDFGLSRSVPQDQLVTEVAGTRFYIDPDYYETLTLTKETDIYSFGVVLFEISSGTLAYLYPRGSGHVLIKRVRDCYEQGKSPDQYNLVDTYIRSSLNMSSIIKFNQIALECIDRDRRKRPKINDIIQRIQDLKIERNLGSKSEPYKDHFQDILMRFQEQKRLIDLYEGGLEEFAKGYLKFGLNREEGCIVYREWAQAAEEAQLVVKVNERDTSYHNMQKNQFGVWTTKILDVNGISAIPHNSEVMFKFKHKGEWIYRLPAWIKRVSVTIAKSDNSTKPAAACYKGVYWDPPASERYDYKIDNHPTQEKPKVKPEVLRIYPAHIGMCSSEPRVKSYREFADKILPWVQANKYDTIQLMGVMEHSHYGSTGYHVTSFFAVSSSAGTPEDLKYLIDKSHSLGLRVLMDIVHSHVSTSKTDGLAGFDVGQDTRDSYFHNGDRGYHKVWDSKLFNYSNWEVLRFLLSNLRWWLEEFKFDGFHFRGISTSILYHHHGIKIVFTEDYNEEYFNESTDDDAIVYTMLANDLIHSLWRDKIVIAEDVSGMPGLCKPVEEGGIGFDFS